MVNVVGIGTPEGAPIPESINSGNFKTDNEGNVVVSRLNEQMCKEIAQNGKGVYVRADNTTSAIRALKAELDKLQKKESTSVAYSEYDEKYSVFAWILFVLLIIEMLIYDKKNPLFKNVHIFK